MPPRRATGHVLPHPATMTDEQLYAEAAAHMAVADQEALTDPLTLAQHLNPLIRTRPHLRVASRELAKLTPGSGGRLLIVLPPQVGKTELAAIATPFWWQANWPRTRGLIVCYNMELAITRGRKVRSLVASEGHRYGLELERGASPARNWSTTAGGGVKSAGIGSGITGRPAEWGVIDDPVEGREDADSPKMREKLWDWYSGEFNTRLAPGAPVVVMMTRWHEDDLIGRLIKEQGLVEHGGKWTLCYMPAVAEEASEERGIPVDALGRSPGQPLPHPVIRTSDTAALSAYWAGKRDTSTVRDWYSLYQGNPRPVKGALVTRALMRSRRDLLPTAEPVTAAVSVDPSGGGRSVAGVIGGWLGTDGRLYWSHDRSGVMDSDVWGEVACQLAAELDADHIYVETNYGRDMAVKTIRTAWHQLVTRATMLANRVGDAAVSQGGAAVARAQELKLLSPSALHLALTVAAVPDVDTAVDYSEGRRDAAQEARTDLAVQLVEAGIPEDLLDAVCAAWAVDRYHRQQPDVAMVNAKKNKLLRASPVAQQVKLDRIRLASIMPDLEEEWATWQPTSKDSPGRIDASVQMGLRLLPIPGAETLVSTPAGVSRSTVSGTGGMGRINRSGGGFGSGGVAPRPPGSTR